jgi:hypothetical protein
MPRDPTRPEPTNDVANDNDNVETGVPGSRAWANPLLRGPCKARSTSLLEWPGEVSAILNRAVGWDAAVKSQRMSRWETPDISEQLQFIG